MKFVFGPVHQFSKWFYGLGLPVVIIAVLDQALSMQLFDDQLRMQIFFLGAILVTIGGIINVTFHVIKMIKDNR